VSAQNVRRDFARSLSFDYDLAPEMLAPVLGLAAYDPAVRAVTAHARIEAAADPDGGWLRYSRRKSWYATNRRYLAEGQSLASVTRAVSLLQESDLIEHRKSDPGQLGRQSTLRASRRLLHLIPPDAPVAQERNPETIILRDRETGERLPYGDTDETRQMRRNNCAINEAVAAAKLQHPRIGIIRPGCPTCIGDANPGPALMRMVRVFTDNFNQHGRFYAWWQNWPGSERSRLLIDGESVVELDYRQIHPTLIYGMRGIVLPSDFDAYLIDGLPKELRPLLKIAFNSMVNARSRQGLHRAISDRAADMARAGVIPPEYATSTAAVAAMDALLSRHHLVRDVFFSDSGMRLMRLDSDMAEAVMLALLQRGIASLGVHDSFIAQARHEQVLAEEMERAKAETLAKIGGQNVVTFGPRRRTSPERRNPLILRQL
jgi:hypothetical protein